MRSPVTTATTPVTAISAAAPAALHLGACFVHVQSAPSQLAAVEGGNSLLSIFRVGHLHKAKPTRTASIAVGHDADAVDLPVRLEHRTQFIF